jgi:biopolymer transport protein ExbD
VSLIDVLLVVLIFLMVTTTAKKDPPSILKLALPESKTAKPGATETKPFIVSVGTNAPYFYMGDKPVTLDRVQNELLTAVKQDPKLAVTIKGDKGAPLGQVIKILDIAKVAQVGSISVITEKSGRP